MNKHSPRSWIWSESNLRNILLLFFFLLGEFVLGKHLAADSPRFFSGQSSAYLDQETNRIGELHNISAPMHSNSSSLIEAGAAANHSYTPVRMHLRTIRAQSRIPAIEKGENLRKRRFDEMLKDIRHKLGKFSYQDFELVAAQDDKLSLGERNVFRLTNGQQLTLRPYANLNGKQITVWMRWTDFDGTRLLDTKLHLKNGETFVAGAESLDKELAYILALQLQSREGGS